MNPKMSVLRVYSMLKKQEKHTFGWKVQGRTNCWHKQGIAYMELSYFTMSCSTFAVFIGWVLWRMQQFVALKAIKIDYVSVVMQKSATLYNWWEGFCGRNYILLVNYRFCDIYGIILIYIIIVMIIIGKSKTRLKTDICHSIYILVKHRGLACPSLFTWSSEHPSLNIFIFTALYDSINWRQGHDQSTKNVSVVSFILALS